MLWYQYIKKRPFLCAISILLVISILVGLYSCSITGQKVVPLQKVNIHVTDAITDKAVKEAKVTIGSSTKTTDADGRAQFELGAYTYRYTVSAKGYQETADKIEVAKSSRSQSIDLVPNAIKKAGIYGSTSGDKKTINGNVNLAADGITLQNMNIKGNLTVDSAVKDGTVSLKHLNVEGTATIEGGGSHSVHVEDCIFTSVIIDKTGVHVVMQGDTTAKVIDVKSQASLDASGVSSSNLPVAISASGEITLTGSFDAVEITDPNAVVHLAGGTVKNLEVAKGADNTQISLESGATVTNTDVQATGAVQLNGSFENVQLSAVGTSLSLTGGVIKNLAVTKDANGTKIGLNDGTNVTNLVLDAAATVTGGGHISSAAILTSGSTIAQQPGSAALSSGVTATVNGVKMTGGSGATGKQGGINGGSAGDGGTIDLGNLAKSQLASVTISGSPSLTYNGSNLNYNLAQLTLSGKNNSGNAMDISWFPVTWSVVSGPASVSGYAMTITGSGSVTVRATVYGVASNELTFNVDKASPVLWKLVVSGSPAITYNGSSLTYDLSHLSLTGQDQFGNAYSLDGKAVTWGVVSGPAKIQENIMTVTGSGTIVVQASADGRGSNQLTIPIALGLPVLTNLKIFGNPTLAYGGNPFTFDLNDLTLVGTDQFGNPYSVDKKQVEWMLVSGPATISGSTLTVTGSGAVVVAAKVNGVVSENMTLTVAGAVPSLTSLILSGSPALTYNGSSFTYNLNGLSLNGKDETGNAYDLNGKSVEWHVISGPASVLGSTLTITGSGTVVVAAKVGGITSNNLTLTVAGTSPSLSRLTLAGNPNLTYNGQNLPYDLSSLSLSGKDQFGNALNLTGKTVSWSVVSGPATVSGKTLTVTGSGAVVVSATIDGVASNLLTLTVGSASPVFSQLALTGNPDLIYRGQNLTYDLSNLTVSGKDQFGNAYNITGKTVEWNVVSGPANISGGTLNVTGSGAVVVTATVDGVTSNRLTFTVHDLIPELSGLTLSGSPDIAYNGISYLYGSNGLTLAGKDQFGADYSISGKPITWSVVSGPGLIYNNQLVITGSGELVISATVNGVASNSLTLTVTKADPLFHSMALSGNPTLNYARSPFTYDLSGLSLQYLDQFGDPYDMSGESGMGHTLQWSVVSGPAEVSGNTLKIKGIGAVTLQASYGAITSNALTLTINYPLANQFTSLTLSGNPKLYYEANANLTYNLNSLLLTGTTASDTNIPIPANAVTWAVLGGPAVLNGSMLTLNGSGYVELTATVGGVTSDIFTLKVLGEQLQLQSLDVNNNSTPINLTYNGTRLVYDLNDLSIEAKDQNYTPYMLSAENLTWSITEGSDCATISGNQLIITGYCSAIGLTCSVRSGASQDATIQSGVMINLDKGASALSGIVLNNQDKTTGTTAAPVYDPVGGPNGTPGGYLLSALGMQVLDQFGGMTLYSPDKIVWTVDSGPAQIDSTTYPGYMGYLVFTGTGTVVVHASIGSVCSNEITLTVNKAASVLSSLTLNGAVDYSDTTHTSFDLSGLTLQGYDQFGDRMDFDHSQAEWFSLNGNATVSGSILHIRSLDSIYVFAKIGTMQSNYWELPEPVSLTYSGDSSIICDSYGSTIDLNSFLFNCTNQYNLNMLVNPDYLTFSVVSGPAILAGSDNHSLRLNGIGAVTLEAKIGSASVRFTLNVTKGQTKPTRAVIANGYDPNLFYNGEAFTYSLSNMPLTVTDQYGDAYSCVPQAIRWEVVSGNATVSEDQKTLTIISEGVVVLQASYQDSYGTVTSNPFTLYIAKKDAVLKTLTLSGSPSLSYNAADIDFDLGSLTLQGFDQFGNPFSFKKNGIVWASDSAIASVLTNGHLDISGSGTINLTATVDGVVSNTLSLTVAQSPSAVTSIAISGNPSLKYRGDDLSYDLKNLTMTVLDQFGNAMAVEPGQVFWVACGEAGGHDVSVAGSVMTITGYGNGNFSVQAKIGDVMSNCLTLTVDYAIPQMSSLSVTGDLGLVYYGENRDFALVDTGSGIGHAPTNMLNISFLDQYGTALSEPAELYYFHYKVISGPARISEHDDGSVTLTVTGGEPIKIQASFNDSIVGTLTLPVSAPPVLSSVSASYDGTNTKAALTFDRMMAQPQSADCGLSVMVNGVAQTISGISVNANNPYEIDLTIAGDATGGVISYTPGLLVTHDGVAVSALAPIKLSAISSEATADGLKGIGFTPAQIAGQITSMFGALTYGQLAKIFADFGYDSLAAAQQIKDYFHSSDSDAAKALKSAGYSAIDTARALKSVYQDSDAATASILQSVYSSNPGDLTAILVSVYADGDSAVVVALKNICTAEEIAGALKGSPIGDTASQTRVAMESSGFSGGDTASAVATVWSGDCDTDVHAWTFLKGAGFPDADIITALIGVLNEGDSSLAALLHAQNYTDGQIIAALGSRYSTDDAARIANILVSSLGLTQTTVTDDLLASCGGNVGSIAGAFYADGFDLSTVFTELKNYYTQKVSADSAARLTIPILKQSGYSVLTIVLALKSLCGCDAAQAIQLLSSVYGRNEYTQPVIDTYGMQNFWAALSGKPKEFVLDLQAIGYTNAQVTSKLKDCGNNPKQTAGIWQNQMDLSIAETASLLDNGYGLSVDPLRLAEALYGDPDELLEYFTGTVHITAEQYVSLVSLYPTGHFALKNMSAADILNKLISMYGLTMPDAAAVLYNEGWSNVDYDTQTGGLMELAAGIRSDGCGGDLDSILTNLHVPHVEFLFAMDQHAVGYWDYGDYFTQLKNRGFTAVEIAKWFNKARGQTENLLMGLGAFSSFTPIDAVDVLKYALGFDKQTALITMLDVIDHFNGGVWKGDGFTQVNWPTGDMYAELDSLYGGSNSIILAIQVMSANGESLQQIVSTLKKTYLLSIQDVLSNLAQVGYTDDVALARAFNSVYGSCCADAIAQALGKTEKQVVADYGRSLFADMIFTQDHDGDKNRCAAILRGVGLSINQAAMVLTATSLPDYYDILAMWAVYGDYWEPHYGSEAYVEIVVGLADAKGLTVEEFAVEMARTDWAYMGMDGWEMLTSNFGLSNVTYVKWLIEAGILDGHSLENLENVRNTNRFGGGDFSEVLQAIAQVENESVQQVADGYEVSYAKAKLVYHQNGRGYSCPAYDMRWMFGDISDTAMMSILLRAGYSTYCAANLNRNTSDFSFVASGAEDAYQKDKAAIDALLTPGLDARGAVSTLSNAGFCVYDIVKVLKEKYNLSEEDVKGLITACDQDDIPCLLALVYHGNYYVTGLFCTLGYYGNNRSAYMDDFTWNLLNWGVKDALMIGQTLMYTGQSQTDIIQSVINCYNWNGDGVTIAAQVVRLYYPSDTYADVARMFLSSWLDKTANAMHVVFDGRTNMTSADIVKAMRDAGAGMYCSEIVGGGYLNNSYTDLLKYIVDHLDDDILSVMASAHDGDLNYDPVYIAYAMLRCNNSKYQSSVFTQLKNFGFSEEQVAYSVYLAWISSNNWDYEMGSKVLFNAGISVEAAVKGQVDGFAVLHFTDQRDLLVLAGHICEAGYDVYDVFTQMLKNGFSSENLVTDMIEEEMDLKGNYYVYDHIADITAHMYPVCQAAQIKFNDIVAAFCNCWYLDTYHQFKAVRELVKSNENYVKDLATSYEAKKYSIKQLLTIGGGAGAAGTTLMNYEQAVPLLIAVMSGKVPGTDDLLKTLNLYDIVQTCKDLFGKGIDEIVNNLTLDGSFSISQIGTIAHVAFNTGIYMLEGVDDSVDTLDGLTYAALRDQGWDIDTATQCMSDDGDGLNTAYKLLSYAGYSFGDTVNAVLNNEDYKACICLEILKVAADFLIGKGIGKMFSQVSNTFARIVLSKLVGKAINISLRDPLFDAIDNAAGGNPLG